MFRGAALPMAGPVGFGWHLTPLPVMVGSSLLTVAAPRCRYMWVVRPVRGDQVVVVAGSSSTMPLYAGRAASAL